MNVERVWQKVYTPTGEILDEVVIRKGKKINSIDHTRITLMIGSSDTPDISCYYYEDGVLR